MTYAFGMGYRKLSHVVYDCTYHIVWVPKYRYRILTGAIREQMESDIRMLSEWKEVEVRDPSVEADHVHLVCSIPPKVSVSSFLGFLKGKLAIKLFKSYPRLKQKPYWGNHFWARGYFVNTVGMNEEVIRRYVKYQEKREKEEKQNRRRFDLFEG